MFVCFRRQWHPTLVADKRGQHYNGAAAKVIIFDRLGKKVRPGTLGKTKVGWREYPKSPSVKKHAICSDLISADPTCPFPSGTHLRQTFCGLSPQEARKILSESPSSTLFGRLRQTDTSLLSLQETVKDSPQTISGGGWGKQMYPLLIGVFGLRALGRVLGF